MVENPWKNMDGYVAKCDKQTLLSIHANLILDLPPAPFCGNIEKSKILFLNGNPGFAPGDHAEQNNTDFKRENDNCLFQTKDAKLFSVNSKYERTNHGKWWEEKLMPKNNRDTHLRIFNGSSQSFRDWLEQNVSVIECFGYHSTAFPYWFIKNTLPSQEYSFELVRKAIKAGKPILIMCKEKLWLQRVKELSGYPYLSLKNNRRSFISEKNVISPDGRKWSAILADLANDNI